MDLETRDTVSPPSTANEHMQIRTPLLCIVAGLIGFNVIAPIVIDTFASAPEPEFLAVPVIGFTAGCVVGQLILLALWGALSAEPFARRVLRCLSLLAWGCLAWILGFKAIEDIPASVSVMFLGIGMVGMFVAMVPMLVIRHFQHWTIFHPSKPMTGERSQFAIRDIFVWTAIIAAQISLAKLITLDADQTLGGPTSGDLFQMVFVVAVCATAATCIGSSAAIAILGTDVREKLIYVVGLAIIIGPSLVIEAVCLVVGSRPVANDYLMWQVGLGSGGIGISVVVAGVLGMLRGYGYRMGMPKAKIEGYQDLRIVR